MFAGERVDIVLAGDVARWRLRQATVPGGNAPVGVGGLLAAERSQIGAQPGDLLRRRRCEQNGGRQHAD
jgi:hypothetical protein